MLQRTSEQRAADDALREAILANDAAYTTGESGPQFLQGYVVVAALHRPTFDGGTDATALTMMFPDGEQPDWKTLGLLAAGRVSIGGRLLTAGDDCGEDQGP